MDWKSTENKQLVAAMLSLRTSEEAQSFLRDLLTQGEIKEFALRLQTAVMLNAGVSYTDITKATGFSSTTIARVSKWLQKESGGYRTVISRLPSYDDRSAPSGRRSPSYDDCSAPSGRRSHSHAPKPKLRRGLSS